MELFLFLTAVGQSFAISLGVGSSTLAVVNFFVAIADGKIDETERKMMGVTYVILRVAMVIILATTVVLVFGSYLTPDNIIFTPLVLGQLTTIAVLYLNALLMTLRRMPSTFGPAFQAASWYTLGTLQALFALRATDFTYGQFLLGYITAITLMVAIINGTMAYLKSKRPQPLA